MKRGKRKKGNFGDKLRNLLTRRHVKRRRRRSNYRASAEEDDIYRDEEEDSDYVPFVKLTQKEQSPKSSRTKLQKLLDIEGKNSCDFSHAFEYRPNKTGGSINRSSSVDSSKSGFIGNWIQTGESVNRSSSVETTKSESLRNRNQNANFGKRKDRKNAKFYRKSSAQSGNVRKDSSNASFKKYSRLKCSTNYRHSNPNEHLDPDHPPFVLRFLPLEPPQKNKGRELICCCRLCSCCRPNPKEYDDCECQNEVQQNSDKVSPLASLCSALMTILLIVLILGLVGLIGYWILTKGSVGAEPKAATEDCGFFCWLFSGYRMNDELWL